LMRQNCMSSGDCGLKLAVVAETMQPGMSISYVARTAQETHRNRGE
jgi:hypothetical protein